MFPLQKHRFCRGLLALSSHPVKDLHPYNPNTVRVRIGPSPREPISTTRTHANSIFRQLSGRVVAKHSGYSKTHQNLVIDGFAVILPKATFRYACSSALAFFITRRHSAALLNFAAQSRFLRAGQMTKAARLIGRTASVFWVESCARPGRLNFLPSAAVVPCTPLRHEGVVQP